MLWSAYHWSVVTVQADVARVPEILVAITYSQRLRMQDELRKVWQHFRWTSTPIIQSASKSVAKWNQKRFNITASVLPPPQDDALQIILQWLSSKIPS